MRELKLDASLLQEEFFDHRLGSGESNCQKWDYVKRTRHGLASLTDPMSGHGKARLNR